MSITDQSLAPAYSMKQSSVALYAAFPPPPPVTNDLLPNSCDEYEMNHASGKWSKNFDKGGLDASLYFVKSKQDEWQRECRIFWDTIKYCTKYYDPIKEVEIIIPQNTAKVIYIDQC